MASFATQVQIRRGTDAENDAFTGAEGEVTMDLTNKQLRVHDGQTMGGMKIPNSETVFGTSQIQDGAITEPKLSTDLQTKINEKTSGAGRNIGDIFWTTRTDSALAGAVEANGAQYNFTDVNQGQNNVQALLVSGALPSVSIAKFDAMVAEQGGCDSFGYDSGATYFKVPKKVGRVLVRCQKPTEDNNYTWYNVYADGWVEQGGVREGQSQFTFPVVMMDTNYVALATMNQGTNDAQKVDFKKTTGMGVSGTQLGTGGKVAWEVNGYADASEYTPDKWDYQNVQVERPMVQLFNSATDEAVAKCTEVLSDVAGLKQATDGMIDYVVESQEPTEANGYSWYRLYKSGWVEQGGYVLIDNNADVAVTLPVPMTDTSYSVTIGQIKATVSGYYYNHAGIVTITETSVTLTNRRFSGSGTNNMGVYWTVQGKAAQGA